MADLALGMVHTSIDAFVNQDPKLALQVCQRDVEVDILDDEYIQLLDSMIKESRWVTPASLHHHSPESGTHRRPGHQHRGRHRVYRRGPGDQASM